MIQPLKAEVKHRPEQTTIQHSRALKVFSDTPTRFKNQKPKTHHGPLAASLPDWSHGCDSIANSCPASQWWAPNGFSTPAKSTSWVEVAHSEKFGTWIFETKPEINSPLPNLPKICAELQGWIFLGLEIGGLYSEAQCFSKPFFS